MSIQALRTGEHPLDAELGDSWMLSWLIPAFQVLTRNWKALLPWALAFGAYLWLLPHLLLAGGSGGSDFEQFFDRLQTTAVTVALMAFGYAALARSEGSDYGLGGVLPLPLAAQRLTLVTLVWIVGSGLVGWLLAKALVALAQTGFAIQMAMKLFELMGWWSVPFVLWLLSPIASFSGTVHALTQVRAIRGEEPILELVWSSVVIVFTQPMRLLIPTYVVFGMLILVGYGSLELLADGMVTLMRGLGWGSIIVFGAVIVTLSLPFWFVIERAYVPFMGIEDDVDSTPMAEVAPAPAEDPAVELARLQTEQGADAAARRLANWVRARQQPQPELVRLAGLLSDKAAWSRELGAVAAEWQDNGRPGELAFAVATGLAADGAFLMDRPASVLAISKRLTVQERVDLATRLLINFLKHHRAHADHLPSGLQLARVLAMHSGNADGARKLLGQLQQLYPNDPQAQQLSKQLGLG